MMPTKSCAACGDTKELSEFHKNRRGKYGVSSYCKECKQKRDRKRWSTPEGRMAERELWLKRKYGISLDEYDAMVDEQNGKCAICGTEEPGGRHKRFDVDHCHETGRVRGLLCNDCNRGLGLLGDNLKSLSLAVLYLAKSEEANEDEVPFIPDGDIDLVGVAPGDRFIHKN